MPRAGHQIYGREHGGAKDLQRPSLAPGLA